jgi:iron(III) transport system substrate-binding protein
MKNGAMNAPNEPRKDRNWPKDKFGQSEVLVQLWWWGFPVFALMLALLPLLVLAAGGSKEKRVVVYCAQDQVYAEPIFKEFEKRTGIKIGAVFDSEAVKTVGLANRLLAERAHPQCDVFWGNEEMRARQLAAQDVFRETNGWSAFGYRSRRIVINTNHLTLAIAPKSLLELTNAAWRRKVALAYPQFGTTATHLHALRQLWGDTAWQAWCRALAANQPFLVDGNSVVVKIVARGEAWVGLTDSDDIADGQREGLPVAACSLSEETLLIPNTVAVIRSAPHLLAGQSLFEYLQRREVCDQLVAAGALEGFSPSATSGPALRVDWPRLLADLENTTAKLSAIFLR